jgi:hypothetical protein
MYDTIAHKLVTTFTSSSMCEAVLSMVYSLFGAIDYSQIILNNLAKNGDINELQTGTAKDYIHNQSNEYPNG